MASSPSISDEKRMEYMDTIKSFMIEDSKWGVKSRLNYLVALGMSAYTEILGGLIETYSLTTMVHTNCFSGTILIRNAGANIWR